MLNDLSICYAFVLTQYNEQNSTCPFKPSEISWTFSRLKNVVVTKTIHFVVSVSIWGSSSWEWQIVFCDKRFLSE